LHYREITKRMLGRGLWQTTGKTPWETVNAQLAVQIITEGSGCIFQRTGKGTFALRAWGLPEYHVTKKKDTPSDSHDPEPSYSEPADSPAGRPPAAAVAQTSSLSFADAAAWVLGEAGDKKSMHYQTITKTALDKGYLQSSGKTPAATLYSVILTEIDRQTQQGNTPRFVKHGKGLVGLSKWAPQGLAQQISQHNIMVRDRMLTRLKAMPPADFEELVGKLLGKLGFEAISQTKYSGDGGIDVRGTMVVGGVIRISMAVQAKRWKGNVQAPIVQQVRGSLGSHEQGLIITTSDFSVGAVKEANRANTVPVALMNGEQLVALLVQYGIGVVREAHDLLSLAGDPQLADGSL
jgi:restriction system protein